MQAERRGDYGKVAELRYGIIAGLDKEISKYKDEIEKKRSGEALLREDVRAEDIAEVVSKWTGIPVSRMLESEREKLQNLEEVLHKRVVGQDDAIRAVSDAIRRSRAGLSDEKKPVGSFIFLGTTGVGKTELARALAEFLFNDENLLTRIDMSEYQERHSVSRLIGAPPGYIGYDEGGQLTEAVRHKPYSVVLLDEIEKAHPDVFNILLQVLDEGRLTDNKGRTINFKNVIIIMTSNLGSDVIRDKMEEFDNQLSPDEEELLKKEIFLMLRKFMRPEFLNRIDEIVMFKPLNADQIREVVEIQISGLIHLLDSRGISLEVSESTINWLAAKGFDPQLGARPVKRLIQKELVDKISKEIIAGRIVKEDRIIINMKDNSILLKNENQERV